jgi:TolB-like protein
LILRALAIVFAAMGFVAGAAGAAPKLRVAVLPILVHSTEGRGYLQAGLADMLASRLGRSAGILVVRVEDESQATSRLPDARAAARSVDADYVLFGSFTHFGEGASLDVLCAAVDDTSESLEPRQIFVQSGTIGEIIPKIDTVVEKAARYMTNPQHPGEPAVSASPPEVGSGESAELLDALSELDTLRERVDALERAQSETRDGILRADTDDRGGFQPLESGDPKSDRLP